jgi:hypothetical protein
MLENENNIKVVSCLLYLSSGLLAILGGLIVFIWRQHEKDNDKQFEYNRNDHIRLHDRIDSLKNSR